MKSILTRIIFGNEYAVVFDDSVGAVIPPTVCTVGYKYSVVFDDSMYPDSHPHLAVWATNILSASPIENWRHQLSALQRGSRREAKAGRLPGLFVCSLLNYKVFISLDIHT